MGFEEKTIFLKIDEIGVCNSSATDYKEESDQKSIKKVLNYGHQTKATEQTKARRPSIHMAIVK